MLFLRITVFLVVAIKVSSSLRTVQSQIHVPTSDPPWLSQRSMHAGEARPLNRNKFNTVLARHQQKQASKRRSEGSFKDSVHPTKKRPKSKLHVGKNTMASSLVKSRIVKSEPIEVPPARIVEELPFDFADDVNPIVPNALTQNIVHQDEKSRTKPLKPPTDTDIFKAFKYPLELRNKPAFCRKCFMFWRSVTQGAPNAKLMDYCCTTGRHSREFLREYLPESIALKLKLK